MRDTKFWKLRRRAGIGPSIDERAVPQFEHQQGPEAVLMFLVALHVLVKIQLNDIRTEVAARPCRRTEKDVVGEVLDLAAEPPLERHAESAFRPADDGLRQRVLHDTFQQVLLDASLDLHAKRQ